MKRYFVTLAVLAALLIFHAYQPCRLWAGVSAVSLSTNKSIVAPGEEFTVSFSVSPVLPENAWIGIIPSKIQHGSEAVNDQHDLTYQYVQGRTNGTMSFKAPSTPGTFDLRFNDSDDNGVELAFVSLTVKAQAPPSPAAPIGDAGLRLDKNSYRPGETIRLYFNAPASYADNAWIGIIPSKIAHGSESLNDEHDSTYQYINKRTSGEMIFNAPSQPGNYDLRMNDTDNDGREVASVSLTVTAQAPSSAAPIGNAGLRLDKNSYRPGETIRLYFNAPASYADNAWIGIIPSKIAHGSESLNDEHDSTYQYINKRTSGEMIFNAPSQPGNYDFRMNDTDNNGREVDSVTFYVY